MKQALGEDITAAALGGVPVHERNGVCHLVAGGDLEAAALTRELLGYLPQSAGEAAPRRRPEPAPERDPGLLLPDSPRSYYDVRDVIRGLVDRGALPGAVAALGPQHGRRLRAAGGRAGRRRRQPVRATSAGSSTSRPPQKGARFVRTCDRFGLPLLVLVDTPGFMPGSRQESAGVIRHGAELLRAFAAARSPRVTVVLRKAYGGAFITMNSQGPRRARRLRVARAEIGIMSPRARSRSSIAAS